MIAIPTDHVCTFVVRDCHGAWDRSTHGLEHASFALESISLVVDSIGDNSCVTARMSLLH